MMMKTMWVWMLLTLFGELCGRCYGCLEEERTGIKALINQNSFYGYLRDWTVNDCCEWSGIECDTTTRRVIKLSFGGARDSRLGDWVLNASLFLPFEELQSLDLTNNQLVGCFENEGFEVLSSKLKKMNVLDLSYNFQFNNEGLLSCFTELSSLKSLDLSHNQYFNDFKALSSRLNVLEKLYLRGNQFNDSIFSSLSGFASLKSLDLSENQLTGSTGFYDFKVLSSRLKKLENLYLQENQYNDSIFSSLTGFSSLKTLDLSYNQLTGSASFNGLRNLEVFYLEGVHISKSIFFQSLGAMPSLKTLYLNHSSLKRMVIDSGTFFNSTTLEELILDYCYLPRNFLRNIRTLPALKVLSVGKTDLRGFLPNWGWCELKNLEELDFSMNKLEGALPACLGNLSSLKRLDVSENQFTGNIASGPLTNLASLEFISLSRNDFEVPISLKPFMNHSNLKIFVCDFNRLITEPPALYKLIPKFQLTLFSLSRSTSKTLVAEIPNFLYYQYDLRVLDLSKNNFSGMFPSWLLKNNTRLERLYMRENSFTGSLQLQNHPNPDMLIIDVSDNNMHGHISRDMSMVFPNLGRLMMHENGLTGGVPSCFGNMSSLKALDLSNNQLSKVKLEQLMTLQFIKLSNNNFDEQISSSSLNSSTLKYLFIGNNNFWGQISDFPSTRRLDLFAFDLGENQFSGMLPRWIANMSLQVIDLSKNHFEGPIPRDFCKIVGLQYLDLSENNLFGSIPSCFDPPDIIHLRLSKNQLGGPLFFSSSSLATLDLVHNYFTGSIPNWIGKLSSLSALLLKANHFDGELPVWMCSLKHLSILDVSQNKLSGPLPSCLGHLSLDKDWYLTFNEYGTIYMYEYNSYDATMESYYSASSIEATVDFTTKRNSYGYKGYILYFMTGMDLSSNNFSGEIPLEMGNLSGIHALNFSHNNLIGSIPATFSNLQQIESLDLSYNNLNGTIPPQLTVLTKLAVFSVAYNNLSGEVPELKNQFGTFDESSYEGNPFLRGFLKKNCCEHESPSLPMPSGGQEDDGFLDMNVFYVSFGVCYTIVVLTIAVVLYINPYWRRRWFHFIEEFIDTCYCFVVINFRKLYNFRRS